MSRDDAEEQESSSEDSSSASSSDGERATEGKEKKGHLLCRNPRAAMIIAAAGFAQASAAVFQTFVLGPLQGELWGKNMAVWGAWLGIAINIIGAVSGGAFGRLCDRIDRKVACALFFAGTFLPSWVLLFAGLSENGLYVASGAKILGAVVAASNVPVALLNDVTAFQDRDMATGTLFALTNGATVILNGVPAVVIPILHLVHTNMTVMLIYSIILSGFSFLLLFLMAPGGEMPAESSGDSDDASAISDHEAVVQQGACKQIQRAACDPVKLIFRHNRLRPMCASAFLMAFSGTLLMATSGQFFNDVLGLLPYGHPWEFQLVSVLQTLPGQLLVIPGYYLTGVLSKQKGSLVLLRKLIPFTAALMLPGAFMVFLPKFWYLPIVVIALNYAGLTNVPLFRMIAGMAPPGRMAEALSAGGVSMQVAGLLGNLCVSVIVPRVHDLPFEHPLLVFFPLAAGIHLLALWPVTGNPRRGTWGAASGLVEEQVMAAMYAATAGMRWRRKAQAHAAEAADLRDPLADSSAAVVNGRSPVAAA